MNHISDTCFKAGTGEDQGNNISMLHLFTDFKAACVSVRRNKVLLTMEKIWQSKEINQSYYGNIQVH